MSAINLRNFLNQKSIQKTSNLSERHDSEAERSARSFTRSFEAKFLQEKSRSFSSGKLNIIKPTLILKPSNELAVSTSFKSSVPAEEGSILKTPVKNFEFKFLKNSQMFSKQTKRSVRYGKQLANTRNSVLHAQFHLNKGDNAPASNPEVKPHKTKQLNISFQRSRKHPLRSANVFQADRIVVPKTPQNEQVLANLRQAKLQSPNSTPFSPFSRSISISKFLDDEHNTGLKKGAPNMASLYRSLSINNKMRSMSPSILKRNGKFSPILALPQTSKPEKLDSAGGLDTTPRKVSFSKNILIYRYTTDQHIADAAALNKGSI